MMARKKEFWSPTAGSRGGRKKNFRLPNTQKDERERLEKKGSEGGGSYPSNNERIGSETVIQKES